MAKRRAAGRNPGEASWRAAGAADSGSSLMWSRGKRLSSRPSREAEGAGAAQRGDEKDERSCGREPERVKKESRGKRQISIRAWRRTSEGERNEKLHWKRERNRKEAAAGCSLAAVATVG
jgi:hypothetical protein